MPHAVAYLRLCEFATVFPWKEGVTHLWIVMPVMNIREVRVVGVCMALLRR